jgi:hypothetical protein
MSRAAKQTLSKIHKTVTCNADSSTYMTTSEHQWTLELCLPVKSLSLGLDNNKHVKLFLGLFGPVNLHSDS